MAGQKVTSEAAAAAPKAATPATDRAKLTDKQLAKAVLANEFRPHVGDVRRLAEAVLRKSAPKAPKKGKGKKGKSGKLAKIPQKKK